MSTYHVDYTIYLQDEFRTNPTDMGKFEFGLTEHTRFTSFDDMSEDDLVETIINMLYVKHQQRPVSRRCMMDGDVIVLSVDNQPSTIWLKSGCWYKRSALWLWPLIKDNQKVA